MPRTCSGAWPPADPHAHAPVALQPHLGKGTLDPTSGPLPGVAVYALAVRPDRRGQLRRGVQQNICPIRGVLEAMVPVYGGSAPAPERHGHRELVEFIG